MSIMNHRILPLFVLLSVCGVFLTACGHRQSSGAAPAVRLARQPTVWDAVLQFKEGSTPGNGPTPMGPGDAASTELHLIVSLNLDASVSVRDMGTATDLKDHPSFIEQGIKGRELSFALSRETDKVCVLISTRDKDSLNVSDCLMVTPSNTDSDCPSKGDDPPKGTSSGSASGSTKGGCREPIFRGRLQDGRLLLVLPITKRA